ncbi:tRNA (mnm(5)s(2)U34)-methyltransferase [Lactococcus nasutitermitis]|uniref:tRNA (Mnm(5)s(2)U34)-methyltransferase n=1 Tax=Lactococcus nasutitermitis TaxID=1652957 RepID=A0ABV9JEU4_9LACT|nr:class I SAM-dependent methyltransferase [Lactococcus nasutitermitis]
MIKQMELAHRFLSEIITAEDTVVDTTMGNGYDTLFLTELSNHVFAFDVQEAALEATQKRLKAAGKTATLILDGHENLDNYVNGPITAAIFNLGYLPQTDKSVITHSQTTLTALSKIMERLVKGGRISIMIYYGHNGGAQEKNAILQWATELQQRDWEVMIYQPLNQIHTPPILIIIEKR